MRALPVLLLLAACSAPSRPADVPALLVHVRPDVRVLALELAPAADGLRLGGQLRLPAGTLPAAHTALAEGLDASGAVLFRQAIPVRIQPAASSRAGRASAVLSEQLPRPPGLASVRVSLPAP